jgi:hypothetical protein
MTPLPPSRTQQRIDAILTRIRSELVSTLIVEYAVRLRPATLDRMVKLIRDGLNAARLIGQLHAARPPDPHEPEVDDFDDTQRIIRPPH